MKSGSADAIPSARHVAALDGVRGLAILAVMSLHFLCTQLIPPQSFVELLTVKVTGYGGWGVDLFFVLSGYLITGILFDTRSSANYFQSFYGRRTLRIFPLYYAVLVIGMVLLPVGVARRLDPEIVTAQHVQGWLWPYLTNVYLARSGSFSIPYVSHFWSLAVEEHFYLVWPFVVRAVGRQGLMRICTVVIVGAILLRVALAAASVNEVAIYTLTPCRLDALCVGAWFALRARAETEDQRTTAPRWPWIVAAAALIVSIVRAKLSPWSIGWLSLRDGLVAILFGFFVAAAGRARALPRSLSWLKWRWLSTLGKYSYGLYVFHGIVSYAWIRSHMLARLTRSLGSRPVAIVLQAVLGGALSLLIAVTSYELFEKRFLRLKRFFESVPRAGADQPVTASAK